MNENERQNARVSILVASSVGAPKRRASTDERGYVATFHLDLSNSSCRLPSVGREVGPALIFWRGPARRDRVAMFECRHASPRVARLPRCQHTAEQHGTDARLLPEPTLPPCLLHALSYYHLASCHGQRQYISRHSGIHIDVLPRSRTAIGIPARQSRN